MATHFKDGTAVITGSGSGMISNCISFIFSHVAGIGRATATLFARDGCTRLALGDLSLPGLEETRKIIQEAYPTATVEIVRLDVANEGSVEAFYAQVVEKFGRIDFAANVAGYGHPAKPSVELSEEDYNRSFDVNLKGVS